MAKKESLAEEFIRNLQENKAMKQTADCPVRRMIESLDEQTADVVSSAIESDLYSSNGIYRTLSSMGIVVGRESIRVHRAGQCRCGKE